MASKLHLSSFWHVPKSLLVLREKLSLVDIFPFVIKLQREQDGM